MTDKKARMYRTGWDRLTEQYVRLTFVLSSWSSEGFPIALYNVRGENGDDLGQRWSNQLDGLTL